MAFLGPYTGDPEYHRSYIRGPHWMKEKGYRVIRGIDEYKHRFGGTTWKVEGCRLCNEPMHQIFTFDLHDPRIKKLRVDGLDELPLVSCLNCSFCWEPKFFKLDARSKTTKVLEYEDSYKEIREAYRILSPLPEISVRLEDMKKEDIPVDDDTFDIAFNLLGGEYLCRLLGAPLYAVEPIDRECPICNKEMDYVATIGSEHYNKDGILQNLMQQGVDFDLGETYLYFLFCKNCLIVKMDAQGT